MYTLQPKKMLIINILDILRKYSDENHRLSQKDILDHLEKEYGMKAERKSIKRNLMNLLDFGYELEYTEKSRINKNGEEETIYTDWYLVRDFDDSELRLLIDSILFSKHIPPHQCKELIQKIEGLSSYYFRSKVKHVSNLPTDTPVNKQLFSTIEKLDDAIEQGHQVQFTYCKYGSDFRLHPRTYKDGNPKIYKVNPYQMVTANGRYYLIGNYDFYDNISHYRVDLIKDIEVLESPAKPQQEVEGLKYGLNLPKHMAEHIYMFSGESERVTLKTYKYMVSDLIDWFGTGLRFFEETEETICAEVRVNAKAMRFWALQYAPYVTILSPQHLVEEVQDDLQKTLDRYLENNK